MFFQCGIEIALLIQQSADVAIGNGQLAPPQEILRLGPHEALAQDKSGLMRTPGAGQVAGRFANMTQPLVDSGQFGSPRQV